MFNYLTREPIPTHQSTPIYDESGKLIATWISSNGRQPADEVEVGEAVRWASGQDKWMAMRRSLTKGGKEE